MPLSICSSPSKTILLTDVYGEPSNPPPKPTPRYESQKDEDALNKALRQLEATENLASHYQERLESVDGEVEGTVAVALYEELEVRLENVN